MKLIDPSYTILEQGEGLQGVYKQIELAGRTCYKSEDKITDESAEAFVQRMIDSGHTAMLEHGSVYLYIKHNNKEGVDLGDPFYISFDILFCKYGQHKTNFDTHETFFTTNLRWLIEKYPENWKEIYAYYGRTTDERWPMRRTVKLTTSLHVYKDITRHRTMSFAIESTRFCNYSKDKFGNELTFIKPCWIPEAYKLIHYPLIKGGVGDYKWVDQSFEEYKDPATKLFTDQMLFVEERYLKLINLGWQAQQAAEILPQCIKADMVITGFESDWKHIFNLRALGTTGAPHPEVKRIFEPIMNDFIKRKWVEYNKENTNKITTNEEQ
ncbi:FAD-dependent thymidylate synthase [Sharpea azabuensis]|uniref:FAD-dependent thymidylate synthase n=1 Tax=Sharpea azabuensis TaxID=322505 RepID=UPI00156892E4|nr:FAD-dependent thymidylate synthase [Sharpea azabuensis]